LLAKHARDIILFIRRSTGQIVEANAAALSAYGYTLEEMRGLNARDLRSPETRRRLDAELDVAEETPLIFETVHIRKDGSTFPVEVAAQAVRIDGEKLMVSIIRDITERRLAQQELRAALNQAVEAARIKSEFLATMSHEIRTPLNAVIGMTEILLHSDLNEDQRHCALAAHESGQALLHLINDILDFSKIEAQRVDIEIVEFKIVPLVEGVAGLFASAAANNGVALMTYINPNIPHVLLGDPGRLRQVLTNLTGNAVKFTQNGSVVLSAELSHIDDTCAQVQFSVKDTGIGIEPDSLQRLFEPFRQADGSMTRRFGGTGLGLSISKGLVDLMGGEISVRSAPGEGSMFSFTLTFKCASDKRQEPPNLSQMRALVLDDDPIAQEIFAQYLSSWRMRCDTVGDPVQACDMIASACAASDPYDVVLVDLVLPNMDGFEFARRLQNVERIASTRLIMVTAYDEPERGRSAIEAGFSGYLTKPIRQSQLYDCIINASSDVPSVPKRSSAAALQRPRRILIAEDNAINREVALRQLAKLGYAAQAVSDGLQAVDAAAGGEFDVVLMDCQMPNMDGFAATRTIRKRETHTGRRARIIAMTANALSEDRQACLDAGMDDYISKPVTLDVLARVLEVPGEPLQPFDMQRLEELFEGDRSGINEFLSSALPALLRIVERLEQTGHLPGRLAAAHELKGAAANIGAVELADVAAQIEKRLTASGDCAALFTHLHEAYERAAEQAGILEGARHERLDDR
ncbi:MAG TPA: response regulator, partial [Candidatus Baltobacteraceae bacterium]